ncbi:MAG: hypothetical protein IJ297_08220 [Clostridia bacterium]|nr:hypothetical protein [Clostridia bacterium]
MKKEYEFPWLREIEIEDVLLSSSEKNDNAAGDFADDDYDDENEFFEITDNFNF